MPRAVARACVSSEGPWGRVRMAGPRWYLICSPEDGDGEAWGTDVTEAAEVGGPCCSAAGGGAGAGATVGTGTSDKPCAPADWGGGRGRGGASGRGCGCVEEGAGVAGAALPAARHGLARLTGASDAAFSDV